MKSEPKDMPTFQTTTRDSSSETVTLRQEGKKVSEEESRANTRASHATTVGREGAGSEFLLMPVEHEQPSSSLEVIDNAVRA